MNALVRRTGPLTLLAALAGVGLAAPAQGQLRLRYDLDPGMSYRVVTTTESQTTQTVQGMTQESSQTQVMGMRFEVLDAAAAGGWRVRTTYESIHASVQSPMGREEYDSSDPSSSSVSPGMRPYGALVGATFEAVLAPTGSVTEMSGVEEMMERVLSEMELPPGPQGEMVRDAFRKQFGEEGLAGALAQVYTPYPEDPVAVGESWTHEAAATLGMPVRLEMTMTLTERRGGVAYLDVTTAFRSDSTSVMEMGPMTQRFDLTGEATGTMEVEEATGLVLRSRSEGTMSGSATVSGPMGSMSIPMSSTHVTSTELVRDR